MEGGGRQYMELIVEEPLSRDAAVERARMKDDSSCLLFTSYIPVGRIHCVPAIKETYIARRHQKCE